VNLSEFSVKKPVTIFMICFGILLVGVVALSRLPVELKPNIAYGDVSIIIGVRGEMPPEEAKEQGALGVFDAKYGDIVSVYTVENFSKEICTGPHVKNTCEISEGNKKFKIKKEESSSAGVRRIKAVLE